MIENAVEPETKCGSNISRGFIWDFIVTQRCSCTIIRCYIFIWIILKFWVLILTSFAWFSLASYVLTYKRHITFVSAKIPLIVEKFFSILPLMTKILPQICIATKLLYFCTMITKSQHLAAHKQSTTNINSIYTEMPHLTAKNRCLLFTTYVLPLLQTKLSLQFSRWFQRIL